MNFQETLKTLPEIGHLASLDIINTDGERIHCIPAVPGKLGSLRVYHALAQRYCGQLNNEAAEQGLRWFAEHTEDARQHKGKHPNIDLLLQVVEQNQQFVLVEHER
ncbi:DUF2322 family protein [Stenoxybacter acetivorans]|uniref:DUF2322 family protein n=1 Tax=Stenoxybacter acetivorans TaxID=422441 RepID=UPI00055D2D5F|nr:DUF2322 family protein [Stenoxybacter acetivorans]